MKSKITRSTAEPSGQRPADGLSTRIKFGVSRFELWSAAFVVSAAMLGYEILLARIASVLLTRACEHYVDPRCRRPFFRLARQSAGDGGFAVCAQRKKRSRNAVARERGVAPLHERVTTPPGGKTAASRRVVAETARAHVVFTGPSDHLFLVLSLASLGLAVGAIGEYFIALLASLMVGGGAGSLISTRLQELSGVLAAVLSAAFAVVVALLLPVIFPLLGTATLAKQLAVAAPLLVLQGLPMGMLYPIGLRVAARALGPAAVPWMWAVNGAGSVTGSALTVFVAIKVGYTWSLAVGVGRYLLVALAANRITR